MGIDQLAPGALRNAASPHTMNQTQAAQQQTLNNQIGTIMQHQGTVRNIWKGIVEKQRMDDFMKQCEEITNKETK